jgi:hypothetical protein
LPKYVLQILFDHGANVNKTFKFSRDTLPFIFGAKKALADATMNSASLLMVASGMGNMTAVKVLLNSGADAKYTVKGKLGSHSAKSLALAIDRKDIAKMLP